jgi:hypothetical protein
MESTSCSASSAFGRWPLAFEGLKDVDLSKPYLRLNVFRLVSVLQFRVRPPLSASLSFVFIGLSLQRRVLTSFLADSTFDRPTLMLPYCPDNAEARFVDVGVLTPRRPSANKKYRSASFHRPPGFPAHILVAAISLSASYCALLRRHPACVAPSWSFPSTHVQRAIRLTARGRPSAFDTIVSHRCAHPYRLLVQCSMYVLTHCS